ncbi:MAG: hypothetical protein ACJA1C_001994 [Crocinitomicaceae bacterium]|jgi:hypothetical protein
MDKGKAKRLKDMQNLHAYLQKCAESFDCFLSDCNNDSIDSHSISKSRVLGALTSDKSEKLYMLDDKISADFAKGKLSTFQARNRKLVKVSQLSASTFKGFCSKCDTELFSDLDNKVYLDLPETNFLHSLRAYSYKLREERKIFHFMKNDVFSLMNSIGEETDKVLGSESPLLDVFDKLPQDYPIAWEMASGIISDLDEKFRSMSVYNLDLNKNPEVSRVRSLFPSKPEDYPMKLVDFKEVLVQSLDFANNKMNEFKESKSNGDIGLMEEHATEVLKHQEDVSDALTVCLRDLNYKDFQSVTHSVDGLNQITGNFIFHTEENEEVILTFFPEIESGKTYFIFSAWNPSHSQNIYLKKINLLEPTSLKQFVSNIILSQGTNIYMSQSFVEGLPSKQKGLLSQVKTLKAFYSFNLFK